jgi:hypothetical protein
MSSTLCAVTFRCIHAAKLASFWAEVLERPVDDGASDEFAAIALQNPPGGRPHWMFLKVPEGKAAKNRVHCHLIPMKRLSAPAPPSTRERDGRYQVSHASRPRGE